MYLGFAGSMAGMPLSLYFDIENYSDRPVDYQVEYLSPRGFQPVRITDQTGGFCGSGTILFMVPQDAVQKLSLIHICSRTEDHAGSIWNRT